MPVLHALIESIRADPGDMGRWLALSRWLGENGRQYEAAAVRVFWPSLRDNVLNAGVSLDETLADVARSAKLLGPVAREVEARRSAGPE